MTPELARQFLFAMLIGALVGIERERKRRAEPGRAFGGIRTHILLAIVGGASAWLARELAMPLAFVVTLAAVGAVGVASYVRRGRDLGEDDVPGITSEIAAIAVFLLGAMVVVGDAALAVALAVAVSAVLAFKQPLHGLVARIDGDDMLAGIKLLIASFIVLPLLPREPIDPWQAISPYSLWLLVILISALSLVGYVAMRWLGVARGTAVTGLAGGLVSSTATTLSFARATRGAASDAAGHAAGAGILLAWFVMFLRVATLVGIVNLSLLGALWVPLAAMAAATGLLAVHHLRAGTGDAPSADGAAPVIRNPFSLGEAMRFAALFACILVAVRLAQLHLPWIGLYVVAALAGSADVDAITLSLASEGGTAVPQHHTALALLIALGSNTAVKLGTVLLFGQGAVRRHMVTSTAAIVAVGGVAGWTAMG